jgi:hypothetical protein
MDLNRQRIIALLLALMMLSSTIVGFVSLL